MPYREVTMIEIKEILRLWLAGLPKKGISAQLGVDRKTVRRYVGAAQRRGLVAAEGEQALTEAFLVDLMLELRAPPDRSHGESWTLCEQHRDFIKRLLDRGVRLSKVRRLLSRQQVQVPYATLHRYAVAQLGFGRTAATIPVADCGPGEEVQLDTGWVLKLEPDLWGKCRRVRAWIFTSVRTRHRFAWPIFEESTKTAIEACEAAWEFYGGVFRVVIVDNTKAIVQKADPLKPLINPAFLEYAQSRSFHVDTTRVRSPKDKARVERTVPTVRDDCFAGEAIYNLEQARSHARNWCLREYGTRRHTSTGRMPLEHFEAEEKAVLLPAPTEPYDVPLYCDPKVARDQHAQVAKALYSLPTRLVGKKLRARADRSTVRFYDGYTLVKTHARQAPGGRATDPNDFPPDKSAYARRDCAFFERRAAEHGEAVARYAHALLEGPLPWTRMRQVYALLGLARRYGDARLDETCALALAAEMIDIKRLSRMLQLGPPKPAPTPPSNVIPLARYLRPRSQYALPFPSQSSPPTQGEDR